MVKRGGGDDQIGLRECVPGFSAVLDHDVLGDRQNPAEEEWPHFERQPFMQIRMAFGFSEAIDAEAEFGKGDNTHMEAVERLRGDEFHDVRIWSGPAPFGEDVGVEQPEGQTIRSRTGSFMPGGSISKPREGDSRMADTKTVPITRGDS